MNIKNEKIKKAIRFEQKNRIFGNSPSANAEKLRRATPEEMGMAMLWGYTFSLNKASLDPAVNAEVDLTYATMPNFMKAVGGVFASVSNPLAGNSEREIEEIIEKTIAAYLMLLAINDDGAEIFFRAASDLSPAALHSPEKWPGVEIVVGSALRKIDFLGEIHGAARVRGSRLTVKKERIVETYRQLTGKNLEGYGFDDMVATVGNALYS